MMDETLKDEDLLSQTIGHCTYVWIHVVLPGCTDLRTKECVCKIFYILLLRGLEGRGTTLCQMENNKILLILILKKKHNS